MHLIIVLSLITLALPAKAAENQNLTFNHFLNHYLVTNADVLKAQRQLKNAERLKTQYTDQWQSRLEANENLGFQKQIYSGGVRPNNNRRTNSVSGQLKQIMPSGTQITVNGQKFLQKQNPLYIAYDRKFSAQISQDLIKNAFGKSQRALANQGRTDFEVAELEYRQSLVSSCEKAFSMYTDAFIQQEILQLLKVQQVGAKKALNISRRLYRDRLINRVDKLTSENDYIDLQLKVQQAEQKLMNAKRQIDAFLKEPLSLNFYLLDPSDFLKVANVDISNKTLSELIISRRLESQGYALEKARSDRWTDLQLTVEAGQNFGRLAAIAGNLEQFEEQYLTANLSAGFDLINNTENGNLKNALAQNNSLVKEQTTLAKTQKTKINSLVAMNDLLKGQLQSSAKQVELLEEKMKIAFSQMQTAKLDFQNYLLHRNAYLNQQQQFLNLKKDYWLNQFSLQKEFAHNNPRLCKAS